MNIEWEKLIYELHKYPVNACTYCSPEPQCFDWEITLEPKMDDWCV